MARGREEGDTRGEGGSLSSMWVLPEKYSGALSAQVQAARSFLLSPCHSEGLSVGVQGLPQDDVTDMKCRRIPGQGPREQHPGWR